MPAEVEATSDHAGVLPEDLAACQRFAVVNQEVELDISFRDKSISGTAIFYIFPMVDDLEEVAIDARQCEIDVSNVTVDGYRTKAAYTDPYDCLATPAQWQLGAQQSHVMRNRLQPLLPDRRPDVPITVREKEGLGCVPADGSIKVSLRPESLVKDDPRRPLKIKAAKAAQADKPLEEQPGVKISIPFRSKNIRDGLHFVGVNEDDLRYPHVYTRHSVDPGTASCIFPCIDDPSSRCMWKISIKCPRTLGDAFDVPQSVQSETNGIDSGSRKRKHGEDSPVQQHHHQDLAEEDKQMEMTVICSGNLTGEQIDPLDERKKIMTFECDNTAAQHVGFAIGPFEHIDLWSEFRTEEADEKLGANAAKIHGYCLPGRADEVRIACQPVVAAADYFALEFGRYPFESYKMCFVDDLISSTVAVNSLSFCSSRLLYPEDIVEFEIENTRQLVHALASQYIGIHIVPNQRSDSWLVIGIQWFMTDLFMKTICGNNWYKFSLKTQADKLIEADIGRPSIHDLGHHLHLGDFEMSFMYLKAPLVLFILDQRMSKFTGSTGIARVVSQLVSKANTEIGPLTTSITADDFRKTCEKKSQYRTGEFWEQWVLGAGCPRLSVKQRFNKKNLNVDITINQTQIASLTRQPQPLTKKEFWREYQEEIHGVYAGEVQALFTGPLTVRIHEADGTPYEHYLEIREDDKDGTTWSIAYNTKYKRLKRTKKRDGGGNLGSKEIQDDDVVFFNSFGDVLTGQEDEGAWGLRDWAPEMQNAMDQESYEWIRFDCNFEWLCDIATDMPGYMYLAQLQQDKDVVAHQDAMLYLVRGSRHDMAATIETRTLFDRRYYHGIRTLAAQDLPKHATPDLNYIGLAQLILMYRHFFCDRVVGKSGVETFPPASNDFSDKAQYYIQCAIPAAIARTREKGRCSKAARTFLLDLLLFNDNSVNVYSDQIYISKLLESLTTSLIPENPEPDGVLIESLRLDDDDDLEFSRFLDKAIEEIDKYRRMDEWTMTYQNVWTTTVLDCKMRLMKARVIPTSIIDFVRYLQDENLDLVRIKAFECLVELGMLSKPAILKLLLSCMTTDSSPFVRDRLFKVFARGVAAIALGEHKPAQQPASPAIKDEDDGLIIEQGDAAIEAKKREAIRQQDITSSLAALKEELKGNMELQIEIWRAFEAETIGLKEKQRILEICAAMFDPVDEFLVTFNYPKKWKAARVAAPSVNGKPVPAKKKQAIVQFTSFYKTQPKNKFVVIEAPEPPSVVPEIKPPEPKKIKISRPSLSAISTNGGPATPSPLVRQASISVHSALTASPVTISLPALSPTAATAVAVSAATPAPRASAAAGTDSIAVQPARAVPSAASPGPTIPKVVLPSLVASSPSGDAKRPKPLKKRKSDDPGENVRPKKIKTGHPRKLVKLPFKAWHKLKPETQRAIKEARTRDAGTARSMIVASPMHRYGTSATGSSSPTVVGSPKSTTPAPKASLGSVGAAGATPAPKARKPLPSSTPSSAAVANGAAATAAAAASNGTKPETPRPPLSRKITLKVKPRPSISLDQPLAESSAQKTPKPYES